MFPLFPIVATALTRPELTSIVPLVVVKEILPAVPDGAAFVTILYVFPKALVIPVV